jgi:Family of unknown function (DUF6350)
MTVIDRLRAAVPGADASSGTGPGWRRGLVVGLLTGLVSVAVVLAPALLAWSRAEPASGSPEQAFAVGAALWLLGAGAHLTDGEVTFSLTPLLGLALLVLLARVGAREAMVRVSLEGEAWRGLLPRRLTTSLGSWWAGYAVVVVAAAALAATGPLRPVWGTVALPAVVLPLVGAGLALRPVVADEPELLGPRAAVLRLPDAVRRGVGPGLTGLLVLLGIGSALVLAAVVLSWDGVRAVHDGLAADGAGSAVAVLVQVGMLPNLALWAVSFLAGPGFQVVDGAAVTWSGAESGLLPMVPVLAALPQPGPFPAVVAVGAALVVVAVGVFVGQRAVRTVARLARLRTKLAVATSACAVAAVGAGLLDVVGGGSFGQFRLASVGAPAPALALCLFGWLLLGAVLAVLRDAWRLRR